MQDKRNSKLNLNCILIGVIILLVIVILIGIYFYHKNITQITSNKINAIDNNSKEAIHTSTAKSLDINDSMIKELHSKILKANTIYSDDKGIQPDCSFYQDRKATAENLDNTSKVITVLQYLKENNCGTKTLFKNLDSNVCSKLVAYIPQQGEGQGEQYTYCVIYDSDELNTTLQKIFGKNEKVNWFTVNDNCGYLFDYIDGNYYAYSYPGGGYGSLKHGYNLLEKAIEQDDYIYIYDKFIYAEDHPSDLKTVEYFKNSSKSVSLGNEKLGAKYDLYNNDTSDSTNINVKELIDKYANHLFTYKHTFKKDSNGNYDWICSEIADN